MRVRRAAATAGLVLVGIMVLLWTLVPLYHMLVMALTPKEEVFAGNAWPTQPTAENFWIVFNQDHFFLRNFWRQLGNSLFVAVSTAVIVIAVAALASFVIGRMRPRWGHWVSNAALLTYVIPASFLAIPFYKIMANYGLLNNLWALVFATVTFAAPYAIWVLRLYAESLPLELDEAGRVDGASPGQLLVWVYLPLMSPAMVAVGTYSLLLAWNEYLYAFLLLSSETKVTLPIAMGYFLATDDAPWNLLMATALLYALPPAILYYAVRRYMVTGLTAGGVKA